MTGTGFTDGRSSHYTQFCGVMLRASAETLKAASRGAMEEDEVSVGADFRGLTPVRGFTPGPNGDLSRRNSKKESRRFNGSGGGQDKAMSPRPTDRALSPKPDVAPIPEVAEERLAVEDRGQTEVKSEEGGGDKAPVAQQSYLALTKLGTADKKVTSPAQPGPAAGGAGGGGGGGGGSGGGTPAGTNKVSRGQHAPSGGGFCSFLKGR